MSVLLRDFKGYAGVRICGTVTLLDPELPVANAVAKGEHEHDNVQSILPHDGVLVGILLRGARGLPTDAGTRSGLYQAPHG